MADKQAELSRLFEPLIGADNITIDPPLAIDGLRPLLLLRPGSAEEVSECLKVCAAGSMAVVPAGLRGWLEGGNPLRRADIVLSLDRMSRVIEYSPPDLTITVEAGITIGELNAAARREQQWLPLDPPGSAGASIGAIAACASSGALRLGFGTPRDYVIGLRLAHADGSESKSGGRVVKNVAGYDMNKLYVGSFGTLAILTELTLKLRPLPERVATMLVCSRGRESLVEIARRALSADFQPASVFLTKGVVSNALLPEARGGVLLIRFADSDTSVTNQLDTLTRFIDTRSRALTVTESEGDAAWEQVAELDRLAGNAVRMSVPLSAVEGLVSELMGRPDYVIAGDFGAGIIRAAFDADERSATELMTRLRADCRMAGGTLFIERAGSAVRQQADAWGEVGATAALMKSIKARLDPHSLLNPGRFVSGI